MTMDIITIPLKHDSNTPTNVLDHALSTAGISQALYILQADCNEGTHADATILMVILRPIALIVAFEDIPILF